MDNILNRFVIHKQTEVTARRLLRRLRKLWRVYSMIRAENRPKVSIPILDTLRAWRYGFSRWSYFIYELNKHDPRMFINDCADLANINGANEPAGDQKVIFSKYVESLGAPCPCIHAVIVKGHIYILDVMAQTGIDWLLDLIEKSPGGIVFKPMIGSEGIGVAFLKRNAQGYELNGRIATHHDVKAVVMQLDNYLITDFVMQHEYAAKLYPQTTNTLRLLTLWDYDTDRPFLAAAVQRIGTSRSYPVDNFIMGAGGLSALVDPDTGELGCGVYRSDAGPVRRYERHPENGNPIDGVYVPRWQETLADILRFSSRMPYLPLIGWDVVMTPNGYQIIEINPSSGFYVIQVHKPLLADRRVKRFFDFHSRNRDCS
jgi:hypothetical protein